MERTSVVTGAFGFTGRYIARRLLARGERVVTLTGKPAPPATSITAFPYEFGRPERMAKAMEGARVLYNTYWVRFAAHGRTHGQAIENTRALLEAATKAGIQKVVHISITNPSANSRLSYFEGKAQLEAAVRESGLPYAILRPALLFGHRDVLVNNIAWLLRRAPAFLIPGDGAYRLQPVAVDDLAEIAVEEGERAGDRTVDAIGPETFTFEELVRLIRTAVGSRAAVLHAPPQVSLWAARVLGWALGDVVLTADEIEGLLGNLLVTGSAPAGRVRLSDWLRENATSIGMQWASEVQRHYV